VDYLTTPDHFSRLFTESKFHGNLSLLTLALAEKIQSHAEKDITNEISCENEMNETIPPKLS